MNDSKPAESFAMGGTSWTILGFCVQEWACLYVCSTDQIVFPFFNALTKQFTLKLNHIIALCKKESKIHYLKNKIKIIIP